MPKDGPTCSPVRIGAYTDSLQIVPKEIPTMFIRADDHQGRERIRMKAAALCAISMVTSQAGDAIGAPADAATVAGLLGTYECNAGSSAFLLPGKPADVEEYTTSNPLLRLTIASSSKAEVLWWDKDKRIWKDDPSAALGIKQVEIKDEYWAVTFEGSFGSRIGTAVSGYLSTFAGLTQPNKPMLVLTQTSPILASASALLCDKL
jgi:hypothetical protein